MNKIVLRSVKLLENAIKLCTLPIAENKIRFLLKPLQSVLNYQQMLIQGLWGEKSDPFYQIPFMTPEVLIG